MNQIDDSNGDALRKPKRPRLGLLTPVVELYRTLAPTLEADRNAWLAAQVIPALRTFADVVPSGITFTRQSCAQAAGEMEAAGCDAIFIVFVAYAPSGALLPALLQTRLPILIWNTQELHAVDETYDAAALLANHGVHATQDLGNTLVRAARPFCMVTSTPDDAIALKEISDFAIAAAAWRQMRQLRVGLLGGAFPDMDDLVFDRNHLAAKLGCQVVPLSLEAFHDQVERADDADVSKMLGAYRKEFEVDEQVGDADLRAAAATEIAARVMVEQHRLDAWSYQFLSFGENPRSLTVPFLAASRMMNEGIGFAGEGDVIGAIGTWLLHRLNPPASFSEIFTIDFANGSLLFSHMGEMNPGIGQTCLLRGRSPITRTRAGQLVPIPRVTEGPATLATLTQGPAGRWRIIASAMRFESFGPLPGLDVPHFKAAPVHDDVRFWLNKYVQAGGPHHNAICRGDALSRLRRFAAIAGIEFIEI